MENLDWGGFLFYGGLGSIALVAYLLVRRRRLHEPSTEANCAQATELGQDIRMLEAKLRVEHEIKSGANWFYWIAGLSLINSVIMMFGGGWSFIIGLGLTQLVDAVAAISAENIGSDIGMVVKAVAFVMNIAIAGIVAGFGVFAHKRHKWAFLVGMVLYALDGLIFLWVGDYWGMGFHLFALVGLYRGVRSLAKLAALEKPIDESLQLGD